MIVVNDAAITSLTVNNLLHTFSVLRITAI